MLRDQQYAPCQSTSRDHDAPSINPGLARPLTNDILINNETHQSSDTPLPQHEGFPSRPPMSSLDQIHHRHPIPLDSGACPVTKPAETEEAAFRTNAKQTHRILKRRAGRQKFEENFGLNRQRRIPYLHKSLHNYDMRRPRGPGGQFLSRAEVAAMANGTDSKGDEGCVNDARGPESTGSNTSTTNCPLAATFQGYINTTLDALIVFEACMSGKLIPVFRRPKSTELSKLIQSGNVFVYKVEESGIKRWKDKVSWSSGRSLESFQFYRELEQSSMHVKEMDFKKNGLVKKTIGITYQSVTYRLVSYYKCEDVEQGRFLSPSQHHELRKIVPRDELVTQNFSALSQHHELRRIAPRDKLASQEFSATINTTGVNSTLDHFHGPSPVAHACSSLIFQQGEVSMGYSTEITDFYYAHQNLPLSYLQPQYEEQPYAMFYSLPHYSGR